MTVTLMLVVVLVLRWRNVQRRVAVEETKRL